MIKRWLTLTGHLLHVYFASPIREAILGLLIVLGIVFEVDARIVAGLIAVLVAVLVYRHVRLVRSVQQLTREIQGRADQLAVVSSVGRTLAETLDLPQIHARFYRAICDLLPNISAVFISLFDAERELITCVFGVNDDDLIDVNELPSIPLEPPGHGPQSESIHSRRPVIIGDFQARLKQTKTNVAVGEHLPHSALYVPMLAEGNVIGVVQVQSYSPNRFNPSDAELLAVVANTAAVAIVNARLYQAERVQRALAESLRDDVRRYADELEQRVAERTRELAAANERLKELDRLKSKFVSDVSHDLRTPVANLTLYLDLLAHGKPEKQVAYIATLKQQAARLADLIEDILDLSRLERETETAVFAPVDLNAVVDQVIIAHRPRAETAGLTLTFEPDTNLPPVNGERSQLSRVVANLVANAVNYTPSGQVRVSTRLEEKKACVEVQDTGIGIQPEDLPHLFERFYRGQRASQSNIPGSGLGLGIVKEIVELHAGTVEVESRAGEGSTFRVWLPVISGQWTVDGDE